MIPWIKGKLELVGYIALGVFITSVIFTGLIWLEIELEHGLQRVFYVG